MNLAHSGWARPRHSAAVGPHFEQYGIVGRSAALNDVIQRIDRVAATRSTVLITGETGTGKELVARAIHACSAERMKPFIRVNCAAIPETLLESELFGHVRGAFTGATAPRKGKFSLADGGTILLDEIATLGVALQAKLLRVLQEREFEPLGSERVERVNLRVIAATNRGLRELVAAGRFQEDLYYRLHVVPVDVPPLRQRLDDVPMLAEFFADKHAARSGRTVELDEAAIAALQEADWPGNVRQLENTVERAVVLTSGRVIRREAVMIEPSPTTTRNAVPSLKLRDNLEWAERETVRRALGASKRKQDAAVLMGISPRALSYYLAKYPALGG
jgi:transcriptional regulator with GAF, ATPase, and Fis domain